MHHAQESKTKEAHQITGGEMLLTRGGNEIHGITVAELTAYILGKAEERKGSKS